MIRPVINSSDQKNITSSNVVFDTSMSPYVTYRFCSTTACWITTHATAPVASAADGSMFVGPNEVVHIDGNLGAKLGAIRDAADGKATLTPVTF